MEKKKRRKEDGFNRNAFLVTNNLCEKWVELPDVKPKQIILYRQVKYMFTGNLNRKIHSNPDFHGEETHLLRCMLGRIYHWAKSFLRLIIILLKTKKLHINC